MKNNKTTFIYIAIAGFAALIALITAILIGKYPITPAALLAGDQMAINVFYTLRLPRAMMALFGGFGLGIAGFVYQTIFRNPLASPDIAGVSSGASVGAAFGILFLSSAAFPVTVSAFIGGILAILFALLLSSLGTKNNGTSIVLAGIVVHSLAQTFLMLLKLMADPEKELASIEYWIMGSLSGVTSKKILLPILLIIVGFILIVLLYRQTLMLSVDEAEARMLGISVTKMRIIVLLIATLIVAAVISVTGLVSFIGLLAPHIARLLTGHNQRSTLILSGWIGSLLMLIADTFAKGITSTELPVSIFTSLIGAPFLVYLIISKRRKGNLYNGES